MSDLFKPCPFCGTQPRLHETFGRLVASCIEPTCTLKPSTWLTAGLVYDVRKLAKHWNQRAAPARKA